MLLLRNAHFTLNGQRYCLLKDAPQTNLAYIVALDDAKAMPEEIALDVLLRHAVAFDYDAEQEKSAFRSRTATAAQIKQRDYAWNLIGPLVSDGSIFCKASRWPLIAARAKEVGCSQVTILKHLRRFWQRGQTLDALLADFDRCGKFKRDEHSISGRPSTRPECANYIVRSRDHAHFRNIIDQYYLKDERKTMSDARQRLYERHYSYVDSNGEVFIKPPAERPTRRQFEYFLRKNYTLAHRLRARCGEKVFEKDHRPVLGTVAQVCRGVGHIYEMDATIADVSVVSSLNRADIIGRPTLYYVIDRHSRLIVGWYVGLENPSWSAAMQAIFSMAQDKQELCKRLGINYDPEDWPADGVMPENIYADRGEAMSREAQRLCTGLATTVVNLPSCRPDWKPLVEGRFKLMHQSIADSVPGYNPASNLGKRRATDFGLEACLTIDEFEAIIVKSIITHNRSVMPSYDMSAQQLADHVQPSPIGLWNHDIVSRAGQLTRHSETAVRLALLPEAQGTVSGLGVLVNGCYYQPAEADKQNWFIEGRVRRLPVRVTYDRRRVDTVYVHDDESPGGYFVAKLTARSEKYAGKSLDEAKSIQALEQALKSGAQDDRIQQRAALHSFTDPIVKQANELTRAARKGASKTGRRRNIVEARSTQRDIERDSVTQPLSSPSSPSAAIPDIRHAAKPFMPSKEPAAAAIVTPRARSDTNIVPDNIVHLPARATTGQTQTSATGPSLADLVRQARNRLSSQPPPQQP
jgi:hypothetical protein